MPTKRHRDITLILLLADGSHSTMNWTHVLASVNDAHLAMKMAVDEPGPAVTGAVLCIGTDIYQYAASEVVELAGTAKSRRR